MLQKFKITSCAFILCLFGVTLTTVSPVLAEDSKEFKECQLIKPQGTDLALMKQKKDCFKDLARVLEAANVAQEPLTDRSTDPASQLLAPNAEQEDLSVKISDLERKLANELVAIMVSQQYLVVDTTSHIATLQNAHKNIPDIKDYLANSWKMLEERHNAIIEEGKKVEACRAENAGQVQDLKECRKTAAFFEESYKVQNANLTDVEDLKEAMLKKLDIDIASSAEEIEQALDVVKMDRAELNRKVNSLILSMEEQQARLKTVESDLYNQREEYKKSQSLLQDAVEAYDVEKMKLTAANTNLSSLCNHEALARYRNFKGLLTNAELRRLCNE